MKTYKDLKEIEQIPYNGYTAIGLFVGAGGSCMGVRAAGVKIVSVNEFIPAAKECYEKNHKGVPVLLEDIRNITGQDLLRLGGVDKVDIVYGSPPCSGFSANGLKEDGWGKEKKYSDTVQRVDDLFFEFIRIVNDIRPKVVIAENVKGLTMGKSSEVLVKIRKEFRKIGYKIDCKVLDASDFGVPQKRERLIFIGVRKDLKINPSFPLSVGGTITTKDAIEDLLGTGSEVPNWKTGKYITAMKELGPQCGYKEIEEWEKKHGEKLYRAQVFRDYWNTPCPTLKAHKDRYRHPLEDRFLNLMEERRLQTFPDDFKLIGNQDEQHARIGRSVPPQLMYYIAKNVKERILDVYYNKN